MNSTWLKSTAEESSMTPLHGSYCDQGPCMKINKDRYERSISKAKNRIYPHRKNWQKFNHKDADFESKENNVKIHTKGPFDYDIPSMTRVNWHCYTPYEVLKRFAQQQVQIGDDNDGKSVYLRFKYFMHYCATDAVAEDSPLYMFDEHFRKTSSKTTVCGGDIIVQCVDDSTTVLSDDTGIECLQRIQSEYHIPNYFKYDFLDLVGEKRPPHRWFVIGPKRSGTTLHVDPLGTSAWNMLMYGRKRWVLFPPHTPKEVVHPEYVEQATRWFTEIYPKLYNIPKIEFIQHPGECVYVPAGWHHVVINLEFTIAITHNFCTLHHFEVCYRHCKWSRPNMAKLLKRKIKENGNEVQELCAYYQTTNIDLLKSMKIIDYLPQHQLSSSPSDSD